MFAHVFERNIPLEGSKVIFSLLNLLDRSLIDRNVVSSGYTLDSLKSLYLRHNRNSNYSIIFIGTKLSKFIS